MKRDLEPSYGEAVTLLVDALRGYIWQDETADADNQSDLEAGTGGVILTKAERRKWDAHMRRVVMLLAELEGKEVDPWLNGLIKYKLNLHLARRQP